MFLRKTRTSGSSSASVSQTWKAFPGIEEQDNSGVDDRFQVFATVDFPKQNRTKGKRDCANPSMRISRVDPLGTLGWLEPSFFVQ